MSQHEKKRQLDGSKEPRIKRSMVVEEQLEVIRTQLRVQEFAYQEQLEKYKEMKTGRKYLNHLVIVVTNDYTTRFREHLESSKNETNTSYILFEEVLDHIGSMKYITKRDMRDAKRILRQSKEAIKQTKEKISYLIE